VFELWTLTHDIPGHPEGSTLSRQTLEKAGYSVPSPEEQPAPLCELTSWRTGGIDERDSVDSVQSVPGL
jgi:hypothetical protein